MKTHKTTTRKISLSRETLRHIGASGPTLIQPVPLIPDSMGCTLGCGGPAIPNLATAERCYKTYTPC